MIQEVFQNDQLFAQMPASNMVRNNSARSPYIENFLQYTNVPTDNLEEWFFVCATIILM